MKHQAFNEAVALQIIADAKDAKGNPVLLPSMKTNLLKALRFAEHYFVKALPAAKRDIQRQERLTLTRRQKQFLRTAQKTAKYWSKLPSAERWALVWASEPVRTSLIKWTDRPTGHINRRIHHQVERYRHRSQHSSKSR